MNPSPWLVLAVAFGLSAVAWTGLAVHRRWTRRRKRAREHSRGR